MKTFENVSSLKLANLKEGQLVNTKGYYLPGDGGEATYYTKTTEVVDEFGNFTLANGNVAILQPTNEFLNIKQYGANPSSSAAVNSPVFARMVAITAERRATDSYRTTVDLGGDSYDIDVPIVINTSGLTFKNGAINQTVNTNDCVQTDGSIETIYYVELEDVDLNIIGASTVDSGVNFRHLTGTLGWLKWSGLSSIMNGGKYGFINGYGNDTGVDGNIGGPIWELILDRLWFNNTWSSGVLIPSNGGAPSLNDFDGGSTTYKLSNVHVTNIQSGKPAYWLVNGIDHVILENVTADSCTEFGEFKVKTLIMNNCGMEEIKAPPDGASNTAFYNAAEHNLIVVGQQQSLDLTGFTTSFSAALTATPHADTAHISLNSVNAKITGMLGGTVSTGKALRVTGGNCIAENMAVVNALPDRILSGARINYQTSARTVSSTGQNLTFTLFPIDPDRLRIYLISLTYDFGNASSNNTFICHTASSAGGLKGNTALLLGAIDNTGATLQVTGGFVEATVPSATYVQWTATDLTKL